MKQQLTEQQQRDLDFRRHMAVIDFVNEAEADMGRTHTIGMHSASWPWHKKSSDGESSAGNVQPLSHG